jgi:hypothetical protein
VKTIDTLIDDIYGLFTNGHVFHAENIDEFGRLLTTTLKNKLGRDQVPRLRMSNLGTPCRRKLWYSLKHPRLADPLPPWVKIKFLFGDILETLLLFLAREAGHKVTGEQGELEINGVKGSRDAIIDGVLVDTKSASSYSFSKFKDHLEREDDSFGYIDQINCYLAASQNDPLLEEKDVSAFFVIDKEKGKLCLDKCAKTDIDYNQRVADLRAMLDQEVPPPREYYDAKDGESGNRKLSVVCSYCDFKHTCWPGLRTFFYAKGPVFLTTVKKQPKVPEVNRQGDILNVQGGNG